MKVEGARRGAGRPTKKQAAAIDNIILSGARRMFCQSGLAGTTMDDLAAVTGVTKHTIYRRYPGKTALLDAVVKQDLEVLVAQVEASADSPDPLESLRQAAFSHFAFYIEPERARFPAFLLAECSYSKELQPKMVEWEAFALTPMVDRIQRALIAGLLRPDEPKSIALLLLDLFGGALHRQHHGHPDPYGGQTTESYFETRWQIFLRAMAV
ncbi:MAG: TetR/AcrR family transcriptional regulator [Sphingomonadaceae bacterium]